ncbi:hypothetical protein C0993_009174 [Termitomyces sp. T159_Od127]|nr:hypothetical protein C0993_009174 [Termitomyces sp. T159_Od127]
MPATETSDYEIVEPIIDDKTFTPAELVNFSSDEEDREYKADNGEEEQSNITELVSTALVLKFQFTHRECSEGAVTTRY